MKDTHRKVKLAFDLYKQTFKNEYDIVVVQIKEARENQKTDWGEVVVDGEKNHAIKRELFRMPEKLYNLVIQNLSDEEISYMDSDEYALWFTREFPQFKMTKDA